MAKKPTRHKHIPQRTCVGCREINPKRSLVRIVRGEGAIVIDPGGKLAGRGAYLHKQKSCWEQSLKGSLASALKIELSEVDRDILFAFMQQLPEDEMDLEARHVP